MKKRKQNSRDAPRNSFAYFLSRDGCDCPVGYYSLSKNEHVQQAIAITADLVSNMTVMLMQNGEHGDTRIRNGLSALIDLRPNKLMNRKNFIYTVVKDMLTTGNKICIPVINGEGYIDELIPLPTSSVSFTNKTVNSYEIRYNGKSFTPDEVLHFSLNPAHDYPYIGEGIVPQLRQSLETLAQAKETKRSFFRDKFQPSMIISVMSDEFDLADKEKRNKLLHSYTDTVEKNEPWIIPAGELDIKTINPLTLDDLKIQDSIELDVRTVAAAFEMPAFMLGIGEFKTEAFNNFVATKIYSIAQIIQQELTRKLLWADDLYYKFNPRSLMQYSLGEQTSHVTEMKKYGMLTGNEGRNAFDYSPSDKEEMNEFTALENNIPVSVLALQNKLDKGGEQDE